MLTSVTSWRRTWPPQKTDTIIITTIIPPTTPIIHRDLKFFCQNFFLSLSAPSANFFAPSSNAFALSPSSEIFIFIHVVSHYFYDPIDFDLCLLKSLVRDRRLRGFCFHWLPVVPEQSDVRRTRHVQFFGMFRKMGLL